MAKFKAKNLAIAVFLGIVLVGVIGIVNAQESLPEGGDSFDTAVKLEPGSYEGGAMESGESEYFYINVKQGQEIRIEGTLKALSDSWGGGGLSLYNEERKGLVEASRDLEKGGQASFSLPWLSSSDKDSYKYYIKRECSWAKIASLSFNLSVTNRYDAGSQTDAADTFEKAMSITSGNYTGYLSGKGGADTNDFYKVAVNKGETLTLKVTPPSEARMRVVIYDSDRRALKDEYAPNPGAIITNSVPIAKNGDAFGAVICDRYCSKYPIKYTLNISIEPTVEDGVGDGGEPRNGENGVDGTGAVDLTKDVAKAFGKGIVTIILLWVLGPVVCLIVIGVVIYLLLKKKKK